MLLIIFGAGASYDSIPFIPPQTYNEFRPPLGDDLFEARKWFLDIMSKYPRCKGIVPHLLGGSVERKLQELSEGSESNKEIAIQLTAVKYYLQEVIDLCARQWGVYSRGITNYRGLIDEVEGWCQKNDTTVTLVTFNYDTLLESSLTDEARIRKRFDTLDDYLLPPYTLIKPHGSINWWHHISPQTDPASLTILRLNEPPDVVDQRNRMIDLASSIKIDERIWLLREQAKTGYLIPALAIPVQKKSHYECPKNQLATLEHNLPYVKMLITVGWRGMERGVMDMLANRLSPSVKALVVSGSPQSSTERLKYMAASGLKCEFSAAKSSAFTQFARDREATKFLNQMSAIA